MVGRTWEKGHKGLAERPAHSQPSVTGAIGTVVHS